jgi:RNA polymerase sigma factor (sigma-70 family)
VTQKCPTDEGELSMIRLAKLGDRNATASLLNKYDALITSIAKPFLGLVGADLDDLRQYGRISFIRAIGTWEASGGATFFGWARMIIRRDIRYCVTQECLVIRVPRYRSCVAVCRPKSWRNVPGSRELSPPEGADISLGTKEVQGVLCKLNIDQQRVIRAKSAGLTNSEIGREHGVSQQAISGMLDRALRNAGAKCPWVLQDDQRRPRKSKSKLQAPTARSRATPRPAGRS